MNRMTTAVMRNFVYERIVTRESKIVVATGRIVDMTDRFVHISDTGNGRDLMQGLFESRIYRIQTRGRAENLQDAENLANVVLEELDYLENLDYGDIRILAIRNRAKPRQMAFTDSEGRYSFVAEYEVKSSKD